jgi:hypothetical protein
MPKRPIVDTDGNTYASVDAWMAEVNRRAADRKAHPERYTEQQRRDPTVPAAAPPGRPRYDGKGDLRTIHALICGPLPPKVEEIIRSIGREFIASHASLPAWPASAPSVAAPAQGSAHTPTLRSQLERVPRARRSTPATSRARTRGASTSMSATRRTGGPVAR